MSLIKIIIRKRFAKDLEKHLLEEFDKTFESIQKEDVYRMQCGEVSGRLDALLKVDSVYQRLHKIYHNITPFFLMSESFRDNGFNSDDQEIIDYQIKSIKFGVDYLKILEKCRDYAANQINEFWRDFRNTASRQQ